MFSKLHARLSPAHFPELSLLPYGGKVHAAWERGRKTEEEEEEEEGEGRRESGGKATQ